MPKPIYTRFARKLSVACSLMLIPLPGMSAGDPLSPSSHAEESAYRSDFSDPLNNLSAKLPWRERFLDDASFNPRFSLGTTASSFMESGAPDETENSGTFDASGTIKAIQHSSGKIKIQHGPIERLGMPAMTMMFKVADPGMLEKVEKDSKVRFNVNNDAGGFTVTEIEKEAE